MNTSPPTPRHRAIKRHRGKIGLVVGALAVAGTIASVAPAQAANKTVTANLVDLSETRSEGHHDFSTPENGVRVYTDSSSSQAKAAGYFDVNKSLNATAAVEPTMSWTANGANLLRPGMQLKIDFDADGNIDGILVGEPSYADGTPLYGNVWWLSGNSEAFVKAVAPSHAGGFGSPDNGTLAQWKTAFPVAKVIQAGWSLGSGVKGDGNILNMVIAGDTYRFAAAPATTERVLVEAEVDLSQTRSQGTNTFLSTGGVQIKTVLLPDSSQAKSAGYFDTGALPLSQAGEPSLDYTVIGGTLKPSVQLVTDFDNDGAADGILVGEPTYANGSLLYGNDWWLTNSAPAHIKADAPSHTGGFGSANHGLLSEWRSVFPNAKVLAAGWSLGSGVEGEGVVNAITVGTTRYTFDGNDAPTAAPVAATTPFGTAVTVTLLGSDPDGDPLIYGAGPSPDGSVSTVGDQTTFTPNPGFSGVATFPYTVKDAGHPAVSGTVTITVEEPPADPLLPVTVKVTGTTVDLSGKTIAPLKNLGAIRLFENGVQIKSTSVFARKWRFDLRKVTPGVHVYTVEFDGASTTVVVNVG